MKRIFLLLTGLLLHLSVFAQKPVLDEQAVMNWPQLAVNSDANISSDGHYIAYVVTSRAKGNVLHLKAVNGSDEKIFPGVFSGDFMGNGRYFICRKADSLLLVDLKNHRENVLVTALDNFQVPLAEESPWVAWITKDGHATAQNLLTSIRYSFTGEAGTTEILYSRTGKALVIAVREAGVEKIHWLDLSTGKDHLIWEGLEAKRFVFNQQENELAFIGHTDQLEGKAIYFYHIGMDKSAVMADSTISGMQAGYHFADDEDMEYSPGGSKLFFRIIPPADKNKPDLEKANVTIWNYADNFMPFEQPGNPSYRRYLAVINRGQQRVIQLENETEDPSASRLDIGSDDRYLLVATPTHWLDAAWRKGKAGELYLINTDDSSKVKIAQSSYMVQADFSPGGNYLLYRDIVKENWLCFDIKTAQLRSLGAPLDKRDACGDWKHEWLINDRAVLFCRGGDIFQIDPRKDELPVNLTANYAQQHQLAFAIAKNTSCERDSHVPGVFFAVSQNSAPINPAQPLLLAALDKTNQQNGFFQLKLDGHPEQPEKLIMSDNAYYDVPSPEGYFENVGEFPKILYKAATAQTYLLARSTVNEANLVITKDFRHFESITGLHPSKTVNWLTSELIHYPTPDGRPGEGVLYKPENFDPGKHYPVIVYFYRGLSNELNCYPKADFGNGNINVPWMVSRGYLVFCPDIHYRLAGIGDDIVNYIAAAARMLKGLSYVDTAHIGVQGHSWGCIQGSVLMTKTREFAAALMANGNADDISYYLFANGIFSRNAIGIQQAQSLWENKASWLANDAVLNADHITTPILMVSSPVDDPGLRLGMVEWFTAMHRLGKPSWMLDYETAGHSLGDLNDQLDFTHRIDQFFDHYLKGAAAPKWMVEGLPAYKKQIDDGFELEPAGVNPKPLEIIPSDPNYTDVN